MGVALRQWICSFLFFANSHDEERIEDLNGVEGGPAHFPSVLLVLDTDSLWPKQ